MSKYTDKANQFIKDADAINKFVNGTDSENVTLPNGETTSSMRKLAKDTVSYLNDPANHYTKTETDAKDALVNTHAHVMTKAEFEALAAQRREEFAGSGVVEWGRIAATGSYRTLLGSSSNITGKSNFIIPAYNPSEWARYMGMGINTKCNVNGYLLETGNVYSRWKLPAPNLPTIESDSSNLSKDYKQGDNILLNDPSRNLLSPFDENIVDKLSPEPGATIQWDDDGYLLYTINDTTKRRAVYFVLDNAERKSVIRNVRYEVTIDYETSSDSGRITLRSVAQDKTYELPQSTTRTTVTKEFTDGNIYLAGYNITEDNKDTEYVKIYSVTIKQVPNQKLTVTQNISAGTDIYVDPSKFIGVDSFSRQDLVFLECDDYTTNNVHNITISDKVYPYGNRQYMGNGIDGINATLYDNEQDDDTLFGSWQNEVIGKHYKWSELSESDKINLASDPDNNVYLDENEFKQVTYAIRCNKGYGNNWTYDFTSDKNTLGLVKNISNNGIEVSSSTNSVLLANVQRRNQGVYHPVYNNEGCSLIYDGGNAKFWYETDVVNSVEDCFDHNKIAVVNKDNTTDASNLATLESGSIDADIYKQTGLIESTVSGRPDGLFADEVNERDVEDLRMDAHKVTDYKGYLEQKFNDAVADKIRGKECNTSLIRDYNGTGSSVIPRLYLDNDILITSPGTKIVLMITEPGLSDFLPRSVYSLTVRYYDSRHNYVELPNNLKGDLTSGTATMKFTFLDGYSVARPRCYMQNNTALVCDIIGDPRKIQDRVKYTGGTHSLVKGDYVKHGDNYYLSLTDRSDVDLDNDDYGNTDNWTDLGTDGAEGGYPQEWLENGIFGTPLLVGENGEDLTPIKGYFNGNIDSTGSDIGYNPEYKAAYLKLTRKGSVIKTVIAIGKDARRIKFIANSFDAPLSAEGGANDFNIDYRNHVFINIGHSDTLSALGYNSVTEALSNVVFQVFYETKARFTELTSSHKLLAIGDGYAGNGHWSYHGNLLRSDLINKVGIGVATGIAGTVSQWFSTDGYTVNTNSSYNMRLEGGGWGVKPTHRPLVFPNSNTPTCKILPYLTSSKNRAQMNLVFKEMKFDNVAINQDGSPTDTWGDDNKFQIRDGVSALTDDNGNTVLYGQKAIKLDRFITED